MLSRANYCNHLRRNGISDPAGPPRSARGTYVMAYKLHHPLSGLDNISTTTYSIRELITCHHQQVSNVIEVSCLAAMAAYWLSRCLLIWSLALVVLFMGGLPSCVSAMGGQIPAAAGPQLHHRRRGRRLVQGLPVPRL